MDGMCHSPSLQCIWLKCMQTALSGDPTYTPENRSHCAELGNADHLFEQGYFGFNIHPYETMFVKANRNIDGKMINKLTEWHNRMNYSSFDYC